MKECPKCGYTRRQQDDYFVSAAECPKCGIVYDKYIPPFAEEEENEEEFNISEENSTSASNQVQNATRPEDILPETLTEETEPDNRTNEIEQNLVNCMACGKYISRNAKACPHCGEPGKTRKPTTKTDEPNPMGCLGIIFVIFFLSWIYGQFDNKPNIEKDMRTKNIERNFNWDGSHLELTRTIKESMHDPDSYKHEKTVYWDKGDHLIIETTFRGKNGFGGVVKNTVTAKVSLNGKVLQILSQ